MTRIIVMHIWCSVREGRYFNHYIGKKEGAISNFKRDGTLVEFLIILKRRKERTHLSK